MGFIIFIICDFKSELYIFGNSPLELQAIIRRYSNNKFNVHVETYIILLILKYAQKEYDLTSAENLINILLYSFYFEVIYGGNRNGGY